MASAGTLYVNVAARTERLQKGMMSARKDVSKFARATDIAKKALIGLGAAGATAAAAIVKVWRDVAPQIDRMSKAADRLDVPTEKLSALGHAAALAGKDVDSLIQVMTFMQKNVGGALLGQGAENFERLGLDVMRLKQLSADEMFIRIADAISKLPTAAERSAAAMKIFGRSGAEMLPLLQKGGVGIRAMMADAERLGITFTREQGAMVEAANDAMTRIGAAFTGIKNHLVLALAPAVQEAADRFADLVAHMGGAESAAAGVTGRFGALAMSFAKVLDFLHDMRIAFKALHLMFLKIGDAIQGVVYGAIEKLLALMERIPGLDFDFSATRLENARHRADVAAKIADVTRDLERLLIEKTPSERIERRIAEVERQQQQPRKVELPPRLEQAFMGIGAMFAKATEAPGKAANAALTAASKFAGGAIGADRRGSLAFARAGSAESFRQQAAIRRQSEQPLLKVNREQLSETKKVVAGVNKLADKLVGFLPANLSGG